MKKINNLLNKNFMLWMSSLLMSTILLQSCTFKKSSRKKHEQAQELVEKVNTVNEDKKVSENIQELSKLDSNELSYKILESTQENEIVSFIETMKEKYINSKILTSFVDNKNKQLIKALEAYNKAILRLHEVNVQSTKLPNILEEYYKVFTTGCTETLTQCQVSSFYKNDPRSIQVLVLYAKSLEQNIQKNCTEICTNSLSQLFKVIFQIYDISSYTRNSELELMFLKHSFSYLKTMSDKNNQHQYDEIILKHGRIFDSIISLHNSNFDKEEFKKIVNTFNPWEFSHLDNQELKFGVNKLFSFAVSNLMYDSNKKQLSKTFLDVVKENQEKNDKIGLSFTKRFYEIKNNTEINHVLKKLNIDSTQIENGQIYNEYFYMIDRLFRGHLNLEEVSILWEGSQKNEKKIYDVVNLYIKIEFLKVIIETNQFLSKLFFNETIASDQLYVKVIRESTSLNRNWSELINKFELISSFLTKNLRNGESRSNILTDAQSLIESVKRNSNYTSLYPNMFVTSYFMVNLNAPLELGSLFGRKFTIDPATVMNLVVTGALEKPWFNYAGDTSKLNTNEIIFSYYYALSTGIFDIYEKVKNKEQKTVLDSSLFLETLIKKTLQPLISDMQSYSLKLESLHSEYSPYSEICDKLNKNEYDFNVSFRIDALQQYAAIGNQKEGVLSKFSKLYSSESPIQSLIKGKNETLMIFKQIESILKVYEYDVNKNIQFKNVKKDQLVKLQEQIKSFTNSQEILLTDYLNYYKETESCFNKMLVLEKNRQSEMFKKEIQYLSLVYDQMMHIYNLKTNEEKLKYESEKLSELNLNSKNSLTSAYFIFSQFELLLRLKSFAQSFENPKIDIDDLSQDDIDKLSFKHRIQFLEQETQKPISKDNFISLGLRLLMPNQPAGIAWLSEGNLTDLLNNKIELITKLKSYLIDLNSVELNNKLNFENLFNDSFLFYNLIHINDDEKSWLLKAKQSEKVKYSQVLNYLFFNDESEPKAIFDQLLINFLDNEYIFEDGMELYRTFNSLGQFVFELPNEIKNILFQKNQKSLLLQQQKLIMFEESFNNFKEKNKNNDLNIRYLVSSQNDKSINLNQVFSSENGLINAKRIEDVKNKYNDYFNNRTGGFYLK